MVAAKIFVYRRNCRAHVLRLLAAKMFVYRRNCRAHVLLPESQADIDAHTHFSLIAQIRKKSISILIFR